MGLPRRVRSAGVCFRARIRNLSRTQLKCLPLCSGASPGPSEPVASRPASPAVPARARRAIAAELNFVQPTRDFADIKRRIAEQNARIIADLLKGRDPSDAEDRVVEMRIALHRMKSPCGPLPSKAS